MQKKLQKGGSVKIKRFKEEIFNVELIVVYQATPEEAKKYLEKKFKGSKLDFKGSFGETGIFDNFDDGKVVFYIYLEKDIQLSVLVHEISHLVFFILDDRGADKSDTELVAYYNEYWFNKLRNAIFI